MENPYLSRKKTPSENKSISTMDIGCWQIYGMYSSLILNHVGGIGNWTADGCETKHEQKNTTIQVQCRCFHLTNFAVLVVSIITGVT